MRITGSDHLAFYDSISPIVDAESIDMNRVYMAARWDKGTADYINCPMDREEFDRFLDALLAAESAEAKDWEKLECIPSLRQVQVVRSRNISKAVCQSRFLRAEGETRFALDP